MKNNEWLAGKEIQGEKEMEEAVERMRWKKRKQKMNREDQEETVISISIRFLPP